MLNDFIEQSIVAQILEREYLKAKERNPSYSLRAFAKKLDINSGALSEIIQKKRLVSHDFAKRLLSKLDLNSHDEQLFLEPFLRKELLKKSVQYHIVDTESFRADTFWISLGILNYIQIKPDLESASEFARELGIDEDTIQSVITTLIKKGLMEVNPDGTAVRTLKNITTTDDTASEHIRQMHHSYLQLGERSLQIHSTASRDFTSMALQIKSDKVPLAKKLIRKFQDDFCALMETGDSDSVYMLNMQFFPLGKEANALDSSPEEDLP